MSGIKIFLGRYAKSRQRTRVTSAGYKRRPLFEKLEDRSLLSVNLTLNGTQMPIGTVNRNVSLEALGETLSSETMQSEMMLDVDPTNPLNIAGFAHRVELEFPDSEEPLLPVIDVFYTRDGGNTWDASSIDASLDGNNSTDVNGNPDSFAFRQDPAIAFDALGNLYVAYSWQGFVLGTLTNRLMVAQSQDQGETFRFRKLDEGNAGNDFHTPRLATGFEPIGGHAVYVTYTVNTATDDVRVSGSNQLGVTQSFIFDKQELVMSHPSHGGFFADPSVGKEGELYITWHYRGGGSNPGRIYFNRDLDGLWGTEHGFGNDVVVGADLNFWH